MSTHQRILEMLDRRWIDMGGGREKLAKRNLPPHAYDRSPCFFVRALPTDVKPEDVGIQYIGLMCKHPRDKLVPGPTTLAWHVMAPGGEFRRHARNVLLRPDGGTVGGRAGVRAYKADAHGAPPCVLASGSPVRASH